MSVLSLDAVDKIYGRDVHAVKALSLAVDKGEIVALLGSSGCGKTSTLRMIAGFEAATRGKIRLAGREIQSLPPAKRNVAMAFEGYSLYPTVTIGENIAFALKSLRLSPGEIKRRVAEVAAMLEIERVLHRYPGGVSGGEQQRASLARALIRDAGLHLLDEPMGQLEPQLRTLLRGRIKHYIKERGLTAILVTHDQTEANALADRIAVMEGGILQQYGTPAELKDRPANLFTGTFVGEPPMNVLAARAASAEGRITLNLGQGARLDFPEAAFMADVRAKLLAQGDVTLGIRPYSLRRKAGGAPARVIANQWLGDQTHIAAEFAGAAVVLVEHERAVLAPGDEIGLDIRADDLHLFDPRTGAAIAHGRSLA